MYHRLFPLSRRAPLALAGLALALTAAALACGTRPKSDAARPAVRPVFSKPEPAKNPVTLQLQADDRQVVGWVSGAIDYSGRPVYVRLDGEKVATLKVGRDNTFTWPYKAAKPAAAEFLVDDCYKETIYPKASVLLSPPPAAPGPCVFFVVDRTAYRPGQPLHFAGFLRKQDAAGEFVPLPNQEVEAHLVSERKQVKVAKLKLTSDAAGRVVGEYRFTDADALDHYTLSIPTYKGEARVLLGEYRKSKIKLAITGKLDGDKMKLSFQGLDFLDKPVVVTKASFTAQVVRRGKQKAFTLKGEDFVYHFHETKTYPLGDLESLSEEDLLLAEADGLTAQTFPGLGNAVLTTVSQELKPDGMKPAEYGLDIKREWRKGDCAVLVQGVITDANGREQRASTTVQIDEQAADGKKPVELTVAKQRYFTGEPIEVRAGGAAMLVVMKLSFQTPSVAVSGLGGLGHPHFGRLPAYRYGRYRAAPIDPAAAATTETIRRTLVTAAPVKDGAASLKLTEPGAYKLVAVVPTEDGASRQAEVSVVVKRPDDVNALLLRLDKEEYDGGERLTGVVHSRYADAKALLTLRDSTGIRLVKPLTFANGVCKLDEELPADLRYGCTVDVSYPDETDHAHVANAFVRVVPKDRMLTVDVKAPDNVAPGSTVDLDLKVNRSEPVDLVVSVYDQSLLGIAADKAVDIRNFFLADERADRRLDLALLQRRVGDVRLATLYKKAEEMLKTREKEGKKLTPHEVAALQTLLHNRGSRYVYAHDAATLLRLAGVDVYVAPYRYGNNWYRPSQAGADDRLIDVLKHDYSGWHLVPRFVGNTLLLQETHTSYRHGGYAWHPVFGYDFNGYGGYGYGGYRNNLYFSDIQSATFSRELSFSGGGRGGRGDGSMSWGMMGASANSMHSFVPEGQAFISHMPVAGPAALLDAGPDQAHIAVRRDFSDSAYWNAAVRTNETGRAKVSVKLPDSLTNWQVVVTAVSAKMHVGSAKARFRTTKPIMVWPMLPRTFTEGDRVEVFASVHNRTDEPQAIKVRLKVENGALLSPAEKTVTVKPKDNAPVYWTFLPGGAGFTQLLMSADCGAGSDASLKRLPVTRSAAEQVVTASGVVKDLATIEIPEGVNLKDARLEVSFAPSLAADMADTLNYLVEYPYGCVEQTMSRFLPAIKVAQILRQFKVQHPELEKKLPGCVAGGTKRLLDLQQPDGGWGWNGNGGTHEMMTPYALYGLLQAEKAGYQIPNETAVNRGLDRLNQFIANMGDAQTADRVYCMYVYSHRRDLAPELWKWLGQRVKANSLTDYAMALALEMAVTKKQTDLAKTLAERLRGRAQMTDTKAYWLTAGFSRWMEDKFEITAQVLKAFVAYDKDEPLIDNILGFFAATKRGDRWNSTKDTAMILNAMCDYLARTEYDPAAKKALTFSVNGEEREVRFDDQLTKKVAIAGERLKVGKNTLTFKTSMSGVLYRAVFRYWKSGRDIPAMDKGLTVKRTFHLLDDKGAVAKQLWSGDAVPRGSYVVSVVEATNRLPDGMRYVLVENPRPSGGETVPADDPRFAAQAQQCTHHVLREDREAMTCFHHEQTPQALTVRNVFLAELAGNFVVPPANVELMYQTETRGHSGTFVLKVEEAKKAAN